MGAQAIESETLSIPESVDLGKILKSCQYSWPDYFVDALVHKVFPEYFPPECKSWGAEVVRNDYTDTVISHRFELGFRELGAVADYQVIICDAAGEKVKLNKWRNVEEKFSEIKGITIDAIVRLASNMYFKDGGVCSFYPVEFSDHPVLMDEKYFTALSYVVSSITLQEDVAHLKTPIVKLDKFRAPWKFPSKTCLELRLCVPNPTYARTEKAAEDFSKLHKYCEDNADRLAAATLLAHAALTADKSKEEIESKCGGAPVSFTKNVEDLYCTANEFIKSIEAPRLRIFSD